MNREYDVEDLGNIGFLMKVFVLFPRNDNISF